MAGAHFVQQQGVKTFDCGEIITVEACAGEQARPMLRHVRLTRVGESRARVRCPRAVVSESGGATDAAADSATGANGPASGFCTGTPGRATEERRVGSGAGPSGHVLDSAGA